MQGGIGGKENAMGDDVCVSTVIIDTTTVDQSSNKRVRGVRTYDLTDAGAGHDHVALAELRPFQNGSIPFLDQVLDGSDTSIDVTFIVAI